MLKRAPFQNGPVVYWMSRDQRARDNWALFYARQKAVKAKVPLCVVFCLVDDFLSAPLRHYSFMLSGLRETAHTLEAKNIPFFMLAGEPGREIPAFVKKNRAGMLVTDFDPLRIKRKWKKEVLSSVDVPFVEIDAHNIVPCRKASGKKEYAARTIRPKIREKLGDYLTGFPPFRKHSYEWGERAPDIDWKALLEGVNTDKSVKAVDDISPGSRAGLRKMRDFIKNGLSGYAENSSDPVKDALSGLSPYLHFGQISAQRVAVEIGKSRVKKDAKEAFLEELIIRKELSDNFCFYEPSYDTTDSFPDWARATIKEHARDRREYIYELEELEHADTHDELWNASQKEMMITGKMHGYMRMYWAKKIVEWSEDVSSAMKSAIFLNDKYELDGRDPNGYTGIAWSMGGVHDRAWTERKVFGKLRYMNQEGCRRKFDVDAYVEKIENFAP
jgi:deoxyribodipyrimidine photo-lyase